MWKLFKKEKAQKKIAVLVDHLNIVLSDTAVFQKKILDYDALRGICLEFGKIIFALTFIPEKFELPSFV
ncbi:hypothetical protein KKB69_02880, partial [Patescibacteria group bacterium]|nr:hypothetical protein [Patescibacteria group bacterium]